MKRWFLYSGVVLAGVVIATAAFPAPVLGLLGGYLVDAEAPVQADVALVLAGDPSGNRITTGAELVKQGFVDRVLVSGPSGNYGFHDCDLAIPFAVQEGYPESYFVHFENDARSTADEARMAKPVLEEMGVHHLLLVTSSYHTRRAARVFRKTLPGVEVTAVAAPAENFTPEGWWHSREGWEIVVFEWMKTVAYWFGL